jgi:hypothetical protein
MNLSATSALESSFVEPKRPYSSDELTDNRQRLFNRLRIGNSTAFHNHCGHVYRVKKNSRKENDIVSNAKNIGNCSVCWKLNKTPVQLQMAAREMINTFFDVCLDEEGHEKSLTYDFVDIGTVFYIWLYCDFD